MKSKIMPTAVLGAICLIAALLLALVNALTVPVMEERQNKKNMEALRIVLPEAEDLKLTDKYDGMIDEKITAVWEGTQGYVFTVTTTGKYSGMVVMIGIDPDGKITGTKCTANAETPDYAGPVFNKVDGEGYYKGQSADSFEPYLATRATMTSKAYSDAVKAALDAYAIIKGGN